MNRNSSVTEIITTNCMIVEARADMQTIREIFDLMPVQFLPIVEGIHFVGVILREEFLRNFMLIGDQGFHAADLISREIITLSPSNTLSDAQEIFEAQVYHVIPVVDEDGDLAGIILRENLEKALESSVQSTTSGGTIRKIFSFLPFLSL